MDSFKFGIFLIVIVSGAAFGSRNLASEEKTKLSSKPKILGETEDDDSSSAKGVIAAAGTVIAGAQLVSGVLTTILGELGKIKRKIAIGIENNSEQDWEALNVYFFSGTSDKTLPSEVPSGKALLYDARKTAGPVARGCVGVMAYYISGLNKTLSVLFSVPFNYNFHKNWWDVALTDGKTKASESTYEDMYNGEPLRGNDAWHVKDIGSGSLKVKGSMSSSGTATLEIHVKKA